MYKFEKRAFTRQGAQRIFWLQRDDPGQVVALAGFGVQLVCIGSENWRGHERREAAFFLALGAALVQGLSIDDYDSRLNDP